MLVATAPTSALLKRPCSTLRRASVPVPRVARPTAASNVGARGRFGARRLLAQRVFVRPSRDREPVRALATTAPGSSKMHDFCMTLPYGAFVALGGLAGFMSKGSVPSLVAGGGSGALLLLLGVLSLKAWKSGKKGASAPYTAASAVLAAALTAMMGKKFLATRALFPPGVVAALSAAMLLFYVYNLASGGNPPQREKKAH